MKLRHPTLIRFAAFAGASLIQGLISTLRTRVDCRASGTLPLDARRQRCIYAFWHENMLAATRFGPHAQVLISNHADGELIAQIIQRLGMHAVRGSTTRGGSRAVLELLRNDRPAHVVITPDGPRGPRRHLQPGLVYLASRTGMPIVLLGIGYEKAWRAKSWDRLAVPYPMSLATFVTSAPIRVPRDLDSTGLETFRHQVEHELQEVSASAEQWATGTPHLPPAAVVCHRLSVRSKDRPTLAADDLVGAQLALFMDCGP